MKKVIVTGATGHIGNVLVRELLRCGYEVTAFVLKEEDTSYLQELQVPIMYGDIRDVDSLKKAFKDKEMVFHLAGIIEIGSGRKKLIQDVNVEGTKNVLEACKTEKVKRLIYTSSVHAIPEKPKGEVIGETKEFSPKFVKGSYAKTKAEATAYLLEHKNEGVEIIITHPSGVIGPYEYIPSNLGQLIIDCANHKMGAYINGGYNFVDVRDVVDGIMKAAEKGKPGECYILAGEYVSIKELMKMVEKMTGVKAPKFKIARWFAYITGILSEAYYKIVKQKPLFTSYAVYTIGTNSNFSIDKAKQELGYQTRPMKETIEDTIMWFKEQGKISKEENKRQK